MAPLATSWRPAPLAARGHQPASLLQFSAIPAGASRGAATRAASSGGAAAGGTIRLPIFPLSLVALPTADVPLQIFEARYRVLFSTLMAGSEGIDEGLVSADKPWAGTRRFGMCFFDPQSKGLASVGTVLEITQHNCTDDGRILVQTTGRERFQILQVVEERPVMVCDVSPLEEDEDTSPEAAALAEDVATSFRQVLRLSSKLRDAPVPSDVSDPEQLQHLGPRELSFWVASLFAGNPYSQQALLEESNTLKRLGAEQELLSSTLKYLSAQAALQSAFSSGSSSGSDSEGAPPSGGPD